MHLEILIEDSSTKRLLETIVPKIVGEGHTWRLHSYKGVGRIPPNLQKERDPARRLLLDQLPRMLKGYAYTKGVDAVVVVLDTDHRDCVAFLAELKALAASSSSSQSVMFRLAIEETEAWYLGDRAALRTAYPNGRFGQLDGYVQDSICGTWERLADAIHPGGRAAVERSGTYVAGQLKHEWAERIGPCLDPDANLSPSFGKLRDGLRRLVGGRPPNPMPAIQPG